MRITFIAALLACAMAAGPCFAGVLEGPVPTHDADVPPADWTQPLAPSNAPRFGNEAAVPVPVEERIDSTSIDSTSTDPTSTDPTSTDPTSIGDSVDVMKLDRLRGGTDTVENNVLLDGTVEGNTADHVASGSNAISDGAFANTSGINTVIQNTGSNVLIQNGMVVNVQFVAPVSP